MSSPVQHFYVELKIKNKTSSIIKDLELPSQNLEYLTITENVLSLLPKLEMVINDVGGIVDAFPLLDNDVMSVLISQYKTSEPMIECDFIIDDYIIDSDNGGNNYNKVKLVGYMKCDNLFIPQLRSFRNNSVNLLKLLSLESGCLFENPNNITSVDNMVWFQDTTNYNFIHHIIKRAYIPNDAIFFYGNIKNRFIYTSLLSEMNSIVKFNATFNSERVDNFVLLNNDLLNMFFNSYDIINLTGICNKQYVFNNQYGYYDLMGNYKVNNVVQLNRKFTDLYNKDITYKTKKTINNDVGINPSYIYKSNTFKNYYDAILQNQNYRYNFFTNSLLLNINSMTNVKLFDKVDVKLPSIIEDNFNDVYSGYYLVVAITHNITSNGVYQKKPLLCRNGINKSNILQNYFVE